MKLSKQFLGGAAILAASAAAAFTPMQVTDVSMSQDDHHATLTVRYTLTADAPAFVQLDILTNDVSIGADNIRTVSGDGYSADTSSLVSNGTHQIVWQAKKDWPEHCSTNAQARVVAYYTNGFDQIPGVYMVVDLSKGTAATASDPYPVAYTLTPPDPTDITCCSNQLWLRRIETNTFYMGSPDNEGGRNAGREYRHQVTLTKPYFMGVFPVTRAQYKLVMGGEPSGQTVNRDSEVAMLCPVSFVSYDMLRGSTNNGINWPMTKTNVLSTSFLGILRGRTKNCVFDLPTDAQWENACRAGTDTAWNDGSNFSTNALGIDEHLEKLGWYNGNCQTPMPVGRKQCNAWGLYDCHGNVFEFCLDWWQSNLGTAVAEDPVGPTKCEFGDDRPNRVRRGGAYKYGAEMCRSAGRYYSDLTSPDFENGFRISCQAE